MQAVATRTALAGLGSVLPARRQAVVARAERVRGCCRRECSPGRFLERTALLPGAHFNSSNGQAGAWGPREPRTGRRPFSSVLGLSRDASAAGGADAAAIRLPKRGSADSVPDVGRPGAGPADIPALASCRSRWVVLHPCVARAFAGGPRLARNPSRALEPISPTAGRETPAPAPSRARFGPFLAHRAPPPFAGCPGASPRGLDRAASVQPRSSSRAPLPPLRAPLQRSVAGVDLHALRPPLPAPRVPAEGRRVAPQRRPVHRHARDARDVLPDRRQLPVLPPRLPHGRVAHAPRRGDRPRPRLPGRRPLHQARPPPQHRLCGGRGVPGCRRAGADPVGVPVHLRLGHLPGRGQRDVQEDAHGPRAGEGPAADGCWLGGLHGRVPHGRGFWCRLGLHLHQHPPLLPVNGSPRARAACAPSLQASHVPIHGMALAAAVAASAASV